MLILYLSRCRCLHIWCQKIRDAENQTVIPNTCLQHLTQAETHYVTNTRTSNDQAEARPVFLSGFLIKGVLALFRSLTPSSVVLPSCQVFDYAVQPCCKHDGIHFKLLQENRWLGFVWISIISAQSKMHIIYCGLINPKLIQSCYS